MGRRVAGALQVQKWGNRQCKQKTPDGVRMESRTQSWSRRWPWVLRERREDRRQHLPESKQGVILPAASHQVCAGDVPGRGAPSCPESPAHGIIS